MGENTKSNRAGQIVATGARWILGAVFIYMGMNKVLHPVDFLKLARQYQMTDSYFVLNAVAGALPWFEVFCGLLLVLGIAARGAALVTLAMLIPFTALVWHRAQGIAGAEHIPFCAVKFDCGCGGGEMFICHKLAENFGLMLLALVSLAMGGRALALRFALFTPRVKAPKAASGAPMERDAG